MMENSLNLQPRTLAELKRMDSVWEMTTAERKILWDHWKDSLREYALQSLEENIKKYEDLQTKREEIDNANFLRILTQSKIIGS